MANQTTNDEVFNFSNSKFTREDLITALNEMAHEYKKLSQTFEEIKAENNGLKNSSVEPSTTQLGETDSLQNELSKLKIENDSLRIKSCELSSENERLNHVMSSWTKSSVSLRKMHETQKPLDDKSVLGFSFGESSSEETSTQSNLANDNFKKMNFVKASVTHDVCDTVKYDDQFIGQLNHKVKNGICYAKPENLIVFNRREFIGSDCIKGRRIFRSERLGKENIKEKEFIRSDKSNSDPKLLSSSADCDDITADVIIADSRSCTSSQLLIVMTSSLLLNALALLIPDFYCSSSSSTFLPADFIDSVPDHIFT
ncbi:homeobox-leucine zipper protein GLABRA 2-like [Dorcoceras hygrometricum]|uniref:Homeobox-leucine zipper protein GLABRA 2-like n=1 Tax=Dorcoceras hygrometricum TaxID=472368 RepID=A0A2Z7CUP9_9LAMI|nr:homeobox-leucine zipper protein GLABRA 2-like [Dorcoceras hygrometricum]